MDPTPFPLLAIEDLASMDLDRGAMKRDYRRPELFDLDQHRADQVDVLITAR